MTLNTNADLNLELPDTNLPNLSGNSGHYVSAVAEAETGLRILRSMRARGLLIENPEVNLWIRSLGNKLAARAPSAATPFYFAVAKDLSVNAFATLGGVIVVNAGLILRSESESELAAVLAHEIAHVTQRHIQRILASAENNKFATGAALLVGALATTQGSEAGPAIVRATLATAVHKQLAFSRGAETEADRVGLKILASAGFNPQAMPSFLQKLERFDNNKTADIREFLQNHPLSVKRVADTSFRAQKYGAFKGRENANYTYMREKVRALTNSNTAASRGTSPRIQNYYASLKLQQQGAYAQANKISQIKKPRNISEAVLLAELYNKQGKYLKAIRLLNPLIKVYPSNEAISAPLAQAYSSFGKIQHAWAVLQDVNVSEQTSLEIFEIKQEVARLMGNNSSAYRAVAERSMRTGRYKAAELQLQQAIRLPGSSSRELQEMRLMLDSIKNIKKIKK